jgi:hypothetical protein
MVELLKREKFMYLAALLPSLSVVSLSYTFRNLLSNWDVAFINAVSLRLPITHDDDRYANFVLPP